MTANKSRCTSQAVCGYGSNRPPELYINLAAAFSQPGLILFFSSSSKEPMDFRNPSPKSRKRCADDLIRPSMFCSFIFIHHFQWFIVAQQIKVPISRTKTSNYNLNFYTLSIKVCYRRRHVFLLTIPCHSDIVFMEQKKEKEQPLPQFVLSLAYQCACLIRDHVPLMRLRHHRHIL